LLGIQQIGFGIAESEEARVEFLDSSYRAEGVNLIASFRASETGKRAFSGDNRFPVRRKIRRTGILA